MKEYLVRFNREVLVQAEGEAEAVKAAWATHGEGEYESYNGDQEVAEVQQFGK